MKTRLSPIQKAQGKLAKEYAKHLDKLASDKNYQDYKKQCREYFKTLTQN